MVSQPMVFESSICDVVHNTCDMNQDLNNVDQYSHTPKRILQSKEVVKKSCWYGYKGDLDNVKRM